MQQQKKNHFKVHSLNEQKIKVDTYKGHQNILLFLDNRSVRCLEFWMNWGENMSVNKILKKSWSILVKMKEKRMLYNTKMGFESFISKSNNYKMLCLKKRPVCVSSYFMKYFGSRQIVVVFISSSYNIYRKLSCNSINWL